MSDDDEKLKNLILFKVWATDDEIGEMPSFLVIVIVIALIALGVILLCN
jgi:hypothetical protein